jgi:cell division protein FtsL
VDELSATTSGQPGGGGVMSEIQAPIANRRKTCWSGTPEVYFTKSIDNSRLVKVDDPRRSREMKQFGIALSCLFLLVMTFAWQHFRAIEYGYKIEALRTQRDGLVEMSRVLRLEEASLRDPERIDGLARKLGLQSPQAGQVVRIDGASGDTPEMASIAAVAVISAR